MATLRCRQKQDEVTSGAPIVAPSGQKGFFYFDRVKEALDRLTFNKTRFP